MSFVQEERVFWNELEVLRDQNWLSSTFEGKGDWKFFGQMRLAGTWKGKIFGGSGASLQILTGGQVEGQIQVPLLIVEGKIIESEIECDLLLLKRGAHVSGTIRAKKVVINEGAVVEAEFISAT